MKAEIIFLKSENTDTLSLYKSCETLSADFSSLGIDTPYISNINNSEDTIYQSVLNAQNRSDLVVIIGACGNDTLCKDILFEMYRCRPQRSSICSEHMNSQLYKRGLSKSNHVESALYVPEGSSIFPDPNSIFCGFSIQAQNTVFILLPYLINSANEISKSSILPYLSKIFDIKHSSKVLTAFDCDKENVLKIIDKITRRNKVNITLKEKFSVLTITISAFSHNQREALSISKTAADKLISELGTDIVSESGDDLSHTTVTMLKDKNITVASAESCTGGLLSQKITSVSGASQILEMGICAYSNRIKTKTLGVDPNIIETVGAVSKETACRMAKGIKDLSGADLGIAITGVAGPVASERKPVGTVFIALYDSNSYWVRGLNLDSSLDRDTVRHISANVAMDLIRRYVLFLPETMPHYSTIDEITVLHSQPKSFNLSKPKEEAPQFDTSVNFEDNAEFSLFNENVFDFTEDSDDYINNSEITKIFPKTVAPIINGFKIDESILENFSSADSIKNEEKTVEPLPQPIKQKKKFKAKKVSVVLFSAICGVVILSVLMSSYFISTQRSKNLIKKLNEIYSANSSEDAYSILKNKNSDYAFWLAAKNSDISMPVCNSSDNIYYLNHNFLKNKSNNGTLFLDKKCKLDEEIPYNLIVYGKNLENGGMLSDLIKYEKLSYLKDNSIFVVDTGTKKLSYQIFAVLVTNADANDDDGYIFPFTKTVFANEQEFTDWSDKLLERSIIKTNIELQSTDKILTISTNYDAFENARFVVMAKEVTTIQSADYSINPNPHYPQIWYDNKGVENPFNQ